MKRRRRSSNRRRRINHRRRRRASVRSNPFTMMRRVRRRRHHRRGNSRRRRNPSLRSFASGSMLEKIGGAGAGFFGSRFIPQNISMLAPYNVGIAGYALNAGVGFGISMLLGKIWSRTAGQYALVGTGLAVISRIIVEKFGAATPAGSAAMSGDMDFDLGYYVSERFPFPQGAGAGPWDAFPGTPWGGGGYPATAATAVRAGQAAAVAALPAAASGGSGAAATLPGGPQADRWSSVWA